MLFSILVMSEFKGYLMIIMVIIIILITFNFISIATHCYPCIPRCRNLQRNWRYFSTISFQKLDLFAYVNVTHLLDSFFFHAKQTVITARCSLLRPVSKISIHFECFVTRKCRCFKLWPVLTVALFHFNISAERSTLRTMRVNVHTCMCKPYVFAVMVCCKN